MKYLSTDPFSVGSTRTYRINWEKIFEPVKLGKVEQRRVVAKVMIGKRKEVPHTHTQS